MSLTVPSTSDLKHALSQFGYALSALLFAIVLSIGFLYQLNVNRDERTTSKCRSEAAAIFDNAFAELLIDVTSRNEAEYSVDIYNLREAQNTRAHAIATC